MGAPLASNKTIKRYRINPLELAIFSLVTAGFVFSVFHLFKENDGIQFATLQPMDTQPNRKVPNRAIAGTVDGVTPEVNAINFEVNCEENPGFKFGDKVCPKSPTKGGSRVFLDTPRNNPTVIR